MMSQPLWVSQLFAFLDLHDSRAWLVLWLLLFVFAATVVCRSLLCLAYGRIRAGVRRQSRKIEKKEDIAKVKGGFFGRVLQAYVPVLEKGARAVSSRELIERELARAGFWFVNYKSAALLAAFFENGVLPVTFVLALAFPGDGAALGAVGVALFVLLQIAAVVFDYQKIQGQVTAELIVYLESEIGQYYASDTLSSINLLRIELKAAMAAQADAFRAASETLIADLSRVMERFGGATAEAIGAAASGVFEGTGALAEPLTSLAGRMDDLTHAANAIAAAGTAAAAQNEALARQLDYTRVNQQALDSTVQQYEQTLQAMTAQIGEGIGKIVSFHTQEAYEMAHVRFQRDIQSMLSVNNELAVRLQSLFEQMQAQSKSETAAIVSVKEQMDLYFDDMKLLYRDANPDRMIRKKGVTAYDGDRTAGISAAGDSGGDKTHTN